MKNILLAEDDVSLREFLARTLQKAGYGVDAYGNGLEALGALETRSYDLLLTDIVMPGIDGLELSSRARIAQPGLRVVFITGFAAMAQKLPPADGGAAQTRLLSKPFHLSDLTRQIEEMLAA